MAFTVTNNSPSAGYIAWSGLHVQFAGATFTIADGNTNKVYVWWTPSVPNNLVVSDAFPALTANDCLVFLNKSGVAVVVPTATVLDGDLIVPGTVLAAHLAASSVTADKIAAGAVTTGSLAAGCVTANAIAAAAIGADKIAAYAITADKLLVADTSNMTSYDPDVYPAGLATQVIDGVSYFVCGSLEVASYAQIEFARDNAVQFSIGDAYQFKFYGYKENTLGTLTARVRCYYTDGTSDMVGIANLEITATPGFVTGIVPITAMPSSSKTVSYVRFYATLAVTTVGYWYLRNLSLLRQTNGQLIVDGSILAAKIAANQITTNHLLANAVTAAKVDIASLFAATAAIDAIKTMQVASLLNGSVLELNENRSAFRTPEFLVEIPGAEEGAEKLRINEDGLYAPAIDSPTAARRVPGGVYKVGAGLDYDTLADAFADIGGAVLDGDVVLKIEADDPGGTLRGTRGGHSVLITSGNLLERASATASAATLTAEGAQGIRVTADSAGTYRFVRMKIGRVGDLGLRGRQVTFGVGSIATSGTVFTRLLIRLYDADCASNASSPTGTTTVDAAHTSQTVTIPADTDDDRVLALVAYVSGAVVCAAGDYVIYDGVYAEIGADVVSAAAPFPVRTVADLEAVGCDRVNLSRVNLPTGVRVRDADMVISRTELYGAVGVLADMARVRMNDNAGSCTKAVRAVCGQVLVTGAAPGGTYEGWQVDTTDATISGSGSAPVETTKTLTANSTGTYSTYWWSGDRAVRQGYSSANGVLRGGIWFDMTQIPTGATVSAMKLTLTRAADVGVGDYVTVKAYGTASGARSGAPALTSSGYVLGEIMNGKTKTFDLPAALVSGLADGSYAGIVLRADDTSVLTGKTYSANYAKFGGTDGTPPKLAVTYTA